LKPEPQAIKTKIHHLFYYLDQLVEWVNANYQVLNPEEQVKRKINFNDGNTYPPINKTFNMYSYNNPYPHVRKRLYSLCSGLERLKANITNQIVGDNAASMIANIASIPSDLEMPLIRASFTSPIPNIQPMFGGDPDGGIESLLKNINDTYGSGMFKNIYDDLKNILGGAKYTISSSTDARIATKLDKLKDAEKEVREALIDAIQRGKLYRASRGHINAFDYTLPGIPDTPIDRLPAVLAKHSNLLGLSAAYNQRSIDFIKLIMALANGAMGKLETAATNNTNIIRPLRPGYHKGYDR